MLLTYELITLFQLWILCDSRVRTLLDLPITVYLATLTIKRCNPMWSSES